MNYYTKEEPIVLREYGKLVQQYVMGCIEEPDREQRTKKAYAIIEIMAQLTPAVKNTVDYRKKLWDHLFFIADYKLDIDPPYEIAEKDMIVPTPAKMYYPRFNHKFRHYGKYIVEFIKEAGKMDDIKKAVVIRPLASYMKLVHKTWNNEVVNDAIVKNDLYNISEGNMVMPEDESIRQLLPKIKTAGYNNTNNNRNKKKKFKPKPNYQNKK